MDRNIPAEIRPMTPTRPLRLVLLPGMEGTGRLFESFLRILPAELSPIVVSYPADRLVDYEELTQRVRQSLPTDSDSVLVAESFSGPIAARLARESPGSIRAVIFAASFLHSPLPRAFRWLWLPARFLLVWPGLTRPAPKTAIAGWDCPADLLEQIQAVIGSVPTAILARRLRLVLASRPQAAPGDLKQPILYLSGRRDRLIGKRGLQTLLAIKPDASAVQIDGPHLLLQTRPREVWQAIESFLRSQIFP
jgi:pimeloyl-[acyl-carrier protein] methyl ester esterase